MIINHPVPPGVIAPVAPLTIKQSDVYERYGIAYCKVCEFPIAYCRGHTLPDAPAKDGAESFLDRRIAEAAAKAGGR